MRATMKVIAPSIRSNEWWGKKWVGSITQGVLKVLDGPHHRPTIYTSGLYSCGNDKVACTLKPNEERDVATTGGTT